MPAAFPVFIHLLPKLIPEGGLVGHTAVVIDVLRATTVMVHAMVAGTRSIVPCLEIDEARQVATSLPEGKSLLAGERQGLPIPGFQLGNSPASFIPDLCKDRTVVMTTTNGTRALLACLSAQRILVAAFVNLSATASVLRSCAEVAPVHLVCAGTDGLVSLEDSLLAGALASSLARTGVELGNDEARMLAHLWDSLEIEGSEAEAKLYRALSEGRGGRRVREIGLESDLRDASMIDRFRITLEVARDPIRVIEAVETP